MHQKVFFDLFHAEVNLCAASKFDLSVDVSLTDVIVVERYV